MERRFLCKKCRNVFDIAISESASPGAGIHCPLCCGTDVTEAPAWAPLGSGFNIFENDTWEYQCQECKNTFKLPVPKSPEEGKTRICLFCSSNHLHLMTDTGAIPLYCG